jgi:hypothetical protein
MAVYSAEMRVDSRGESSGDRVEGLRAAVKVE